MVLSIFIGSILLSLFITYIIFKYFVDMSGGRWMYHYYISKAEIDSDPTLKYGRPAITFFVVLGVLFFIVTVINCETGFLYNSCWGSPL